MKIIICGSITAHNEIIETKKDLEKRGRVVEIPEGVKNKYLKNRTEVDLMEKAKDKIKYNLIRRHFTKIKQSDIVLVVNPKKRNIKGYIGGNTLIEMAFAHVLNKKLYCLYSIPNMSYTLEILAMKPIILDEDLRKI